MLRLSVEQKLRQACPWVSRAITGGMAESGAWQTGQQTPDPYLVQGSRYRDWRGLMWTRLGILVLLQSSHINSVLLFSLLESGKSEWYPSRGDVGKDSNELMVKPPAQFRGSLIVSSCYHWCLRPTPSRSSAPPPGGNYSWSHSVLKPSLPLPLRAQKLQPRPPRTWSPELEEPVISALGSWISRTRGQWRSQPFSAPSWRSLPQLGCRLPQSLASLTRVSCAISYPTGP